MRLTVVGSGPAAPQPDTPASGLLVESGLTAVLFDCGTGVVGRLRALVDPGRLDGVVIGHLHADHFMDLAPLRYLYPWPGTATGRPAIWLPPGGRARLTVFATVMSERATFFEDAFDVHEYEDEVPFQLGSLVVRPTPLQHYVAARAMRIEGLGASLVYGGDSGPTEHLVTLARGADLLIAEATLASASEDEPCRGHSTGVEAVEMARRAGVRRLLLTHYPSAHRDDLRALADRTTDVAVEIARPGLRLAVAPQAGPEAAPAAAAAATNPATRSRIPLARPLRRS
ncbi:MAG: MBL fold metallo-hydrolase [Chloroflexi bacterium]|nr:MBL fold metallo-hydrolase [Chloroflexota bacterium]